MIFQLPTNVFSETLPFGCVSKRLFCEQGKPPNLPRPLSVPRHSSILDTDAILQISPHLLCDDLPLHEENTLGRLGVDIAGKVFRDCFQNDQRDWELLLVDD